VDAFLDAVLAGELDRDQMLPSYDVDRQTRERLLAFITDWLFDNWGAPEHWPRRQLLRPSVAGCSSGQGCCF
jgi:hypothetical protein